jgi:hypothetical protein
MFNTILRKSLQITGVLISTGMMLTAQRPTHNPMTITAPPANTNPTISTKGGTTGGSFIQATQGTGFGGGNLGNNSTNDTGNAPKGGTPISLDSPLARKTTITEKTIQFANTITAADLEAHLSFLASPELEGRETAKPGQKVAARYLASQFAKFGLKPGNDGSWFQPFSLEEVTIEDLKLTFDGKKELSRGKDFIHYTKAGLSTASKHELVFAGFAVSTDIYDNLDGIDLKGKAAVFLDGEPMRDTLYVMTRSTSPSNWSKELRPKREALKKAGASMAVLVVSDEKFGDLSKNPFMKHRMESSGLRLSYKEGEELPMVVVPEKQLADYLKKAGYTFESLRKTLGGKDDSPAIAFGKGKLEITPKATISKVVTENVLGLLEGTDKKDEVVVLTAHYDHIGVIDGSIHFGADDDGSGTAALLELAEAFSLAAQNGYRPRRSILFMPVTAEEKGLLGSEYYSDHPVFPLKKTVCNLNIDMIGRLDDAHAQDSNYVYVIGSDMLSSELHMSNELANNIVTHLNLDYTFNRLDDPNQFYYRSDHYNFAKHDIPVIFYFSGVHEDYHKSTDTIDKIMFGKAAHITRLVFATAWETANREGKLVVDRKKETGRR